MIERVGLVGYGEVGRIFASGLRPKLAQVCAWDLRFAAPEHRVAALAHAQQAGVVACASLQALCAESSLLISAVTASSTLAVAREAAPHLRPGTFFLDLNSASPGTKQAAAALAPARWLRSCKAGAWMPAWCPTGWASPAPSRCAAAS